MTRPATARIKLSILDQTPVIHGHDVADAIAATVELAQAADDLGYTRYWCAEHHGLRGVANPAPEVMIARLASVTKRLRVGSGGVMLPYYSPFKLAEQFLMLEALFPNRIDLGVGRAPGGDRQRRAQHGPPGRQRPGRRPPGRDLRVAGPEQPGRLPPGLGVHGRRRGRGQPGQPAPAEGPGVGVF